MGAGLTVDGHTNVSIFFEPLFHGRSQGILERAENNFALYVFLTRQGVNQQKNFATHRFLPLKSRTGSSLARSTSAKTKRSTSTCSPLRSLSNSRLNSMSTLSAEASSGARKVPTNTLRLSTAVRNLISTRSFANRMKS